MTQRSKKREERKGKNHNKKEKISRTYIERKKKGGGAGGVHRICFKVVFDDIHLFRVHILLQACTLWHFKKLVAP